MGSRDFKAANRTVEYLKVLLFPWRKLPVPIGVFDVRQHQNRVSEHLIKETGYSLTAWIVDA